MNRSHNGSLEACWHNYFAYSLQQSSMVLVFLRLDDALFQVVARKPDVIAHLLLCVLICHSLHEA
jgi:hypothetical protein